MLKFSGFPASLKSLSYISEKWCLKRLAPSEIQFFFLIFVFAELLFGSFSDKFAEIWAKIIRTSKNVHAPAPMCANMQTGKG